MSLKFYKLHPNAIIPKQATLGSACFDIHALFHSGTVTLFNDELKKFDVHRYFSNLTAGITMSPNTTALIPTGLILDIPMNFCVKVYPRSSLYLKKGLIFPHSVGIIDSDYVEELFLICKNVSTKNILLSDGDKLAQGEMVLENGCETEEIYAKPEKKMDRVGGIGSTGTGPLPRGPRGTGTRQRALMATGQRGHYQPFDG